MGTSPDANLRLAMILAPDEAATPRDCLYQGNAQRRSDRKGACFASY